MTTYPLTEDEKDECLYYLGYPLVAETSQPVLGSGLPIGLQFQIDTALINMNSLRTVAARDRVRCVLGDLRTARKELEEAQKRTSVSEIQGSVKLNKRENKERRKWYNNLRKELAQVLGVRIVYNPHGESKYAVVFNQ